MMQQHVDKTIGAHRFRIDRFDAQVGSWMVFQLLAKLAPLLVTGQLQPKQALLMAGSILSQQDFFLLQRECLAVVSVYEDQRPEMYLPLLKDGVYVRKELQHDITAALALTVLVLEHNLSGFFTEDGLRNLTELLGLNSSNSQPSTATSSDPS